MAYAASFPPEQCQVIISEVFRTPEQQALYVKAGKSQTIHSKHLEKLAADLFLFKDGVLTWNWKDYEFLGEYWEKLGCVWGGRWETLRDGVHFQYET